jgi:hypothetical protein
MAVKKQISVALENKVGKLADLGSLLARNKVNILAVSVDNIVDQGIVRLLVDKTEPAVKLMKRAGLSPVLTTVVVKKLRDQAGSLSRSARKLSRARINIDYVYGSAGVGQKEALLVFRVSDPVKADRLI